MNIFFHADHNAIMDYHYYFKPGEFWRLPVRAYGKMSLCQDKQFIKLIKDYSYELCATVKKVVYSKKEVTVTQKNGEPDYLEEDEHGLVIFQMSKFENPNATTLTFFMEFNDYDGISVEEKIKHFQEGKNYKGIVEFFLDCGCIDTIVEGLWNDIENRSANLLSPFSIFKVENIYFDGFQLQNLDVVNSGEYIIETRCIWQDELIGDTLNYYVESKVEMMSLGDWKFGFMHLYYQTMPELIVQIGQLETFFTEDLQVNHIQKIAQQMTDGKYLDEDGYPWEISFEEDTLSFIKIDIPKSGWDDEYWIDLEKVDILLRHTNSEKNNAATLTNLKEIQAFANWYDTTYKKYLTMLKKAKQNGYKYEW